MRHPDWRGLDFTMPIRQNELLIGWIFVEKDVTPINTLLTHLIEKEAEKKQIGSEVLDLYREVNLIYNFSEKLANALDAEMIAQTALKVMALSWKVSLV